MRRPLVLAHRGASRAATENTPEAFRLALTLGADGVELDTRRAARGDLVVHHDPDLAGTPVRRLAEPPLPGLAAALDASTGGIVNVELKTDGDVPGGVAGAFCGLLRRRPGRDRVLASSFDPVALRVVRALRPDVPTALVVGPDGDLGAALREARASTATAPCTRNRSSSIARSSSGRGRSGSRFTRGRSTTPTSCSVSRRWAWTA